MKKVKVISLLLILVLVFTTTTASFAASSGDRFRYETVTTNNTKLKTYTITQAQVDNWEKAKAVGSLITCTVPAPFGDIISLVSSAYEIGEMIYDMNVAGTMQVWGYTKTKYKVNVRTGKKTVSAQWRTVTFKLYKKNGVLYNSRTHTIRNR